MKHGDTEKVICAWSGGKDSALALHEIRKSGKYEIVSLLTTVTEDYGRVSMHGVRRGLLERQAEALRLPLREILISKGASNEDYEAAMREALLEFKAGGVMSVVFGDIFLEDLKKYREDNLAKVGMNGIFPIWKRDTAGLAREFIAGGFKAIVTCVDTKALDGSFAGREIDKNFLADLPAGADPCGENGEFHSFVFDGPVFSEGIPVKKGKVVLRDGRFCFCDLVPDR
ncbi:MAG: diphthine--ammonia ligase [bacterium]